MKHLNYDTIVRMGTNRRDNGELGNIKILKSNERVVVPKLSIILLDWGVRERFDSVKWLQRQSVPREEYEIIWVELYDRVTKEVLEFSDAYIACNQKGMYHKHKGYNIGLLHARGELVTVCDSDAVFPSNFVDSIFQFYYGDEVNPEFVPKSAVYMHYEPRSWMQYPDWLQDADELTEPFWSWFGLHPNVGACMTVRKEEAIRFGGFDEHKSYRGYLCGPYDLGWRLVNAGVPEVWCPPEHCVIYHFAHPDPTGGQGFVPTFTHLKEMTNAHVDLHAWSAVEAFSAGRFQPLEENREIFKQRMENRNIGSSFEMKYASMTGPDGFSRKQFWWIQLCLVTGALKLGFINALPRPLGLVIRLANPVSYILSIRDAVYGRTISGQSKSFHKRLAVNLMHCVVSKIAKPQRADLVYQFAQYKFIKFDDQIFVIPESHGPVDLTQWDKSEDPDIFVAASLFEARRIVEELAGSKAYPPQLVFEWYRGSAYNIIKHGGSYFARRREDGPFERDNKNIEFGDIAALKIWFENKEPLN